MTLVDLAEQVLAAIYEFSDNDDNDCIQLLEDAISDEKDLVFAIESGISYLQDCDCEDVPYYTKKLDELDSGEDL